jgi:tripartite-type tricarboxylate transporter receptor subunit TctC
MAENTQRDRCEDAVAEGPIMRLTLAVVASLLIAINSARAQPYPDKPIRLIVPLVAGSPIVSVGRIVLNQVSARLGQQIVIDARPGGGTTIGLKAAAAAAPDGYTLLMYGQNITYVQDLYSDLGVDPLSAFVPVANLMSFSHVLVVGPQVPAKTLSEFVALAKANPGKLNFGAGLGTMPYIVGHYFINVAGVNIVSIPYRGGEQVRPDILGGRVHMNTGPVASLMPLIAEGKLRPLAYTGAKRHPLLPDVPTMIESGYPQVGWQPDVWQAVFAPAGTPASIVERLNSEINDALRLPEVKTAYERLGADIEIMSAPEFAAFVAKEAKKWPPIIKATGVTAQ